MSENSLSKVVDLFCEEYKKKYAECKNEDDYKEAIAVLCEIMGQYFHTDKSILKDISLPFDRKRIEQIISSMKKTEKYTYSVSCTHGKAFIAEWVLKKWMNNHISELTIRM